jgi:hypothetical protein
MLIVARRVPLEEAAGWVQLFNRHDLTGWRTLGGTPATWKVENGILRGAGNTGFLVSEPSYGYFHLRAELRLNPGAAWAVLFGTDPAELGLKNQKPRGYAVQFVQKGTTGDVEGHIRMETTLTRDGVPGAKTTVNIKPHDWFLVDLVVHQDSIDIQTPQGGLGAGKLKLPPAPGPIILQFASANSVPDQGAAGLQFINLRSRTAPGRLEGCFL